MNRDLKKCMLNVVGKFEASDHDEADLDFFSKQIFYAKLLNNNLNKNQKAHIKNHVYKQPKPLNSEKFKEYFASLYRFFCIFRNGFILVKCLQK